MRINIVAGQTTCPLLIAYNGSLGDDPVPETEIKNNDGSYTYDHSILTERNADGSVYRLTGESDGNGKFLYSYRFTLIADYENAPVFASSFPFTLPFILQ